jgi:hypothetical protein
MFFKMLMIQNSNFFMLLIQRSVFLRLTLHSSLCKVNSGEHIHCQHQVLPFNSRQATPHHQQHKKLPSSSRQPTTPPLFTVVSNNSHYVCNSRTNSTFNQTRSVQAATESPSVAPARRPPPFR